MWRWWAPDTTTPTTSAFPSSRSTRSKEPGDETCVFALEEEDDGTALHQYGPCDEWYYILEGEFTVWWGRDAANLENSYVLEKGDCAYYPTGWKYKVRNTGKVPGKFFYVMTSPPGIQRRLDPAR
jgi:mannose-6-phosphate isomerase-like protein (cupin superfamily)